MIISYRILAEVKVQERIQCNKLHKKGWSMEMTYLMANGNAKTMQQQ